MPEPKYIASINAGVEIKCQTPNYEKETVDQDSFLNASKHYTDDSMSKIKRGQPKILAFSSIQTEKMQTLNHSPRRVNPVMLQNFKRKQNKFLKPLRENSNKKFVTERFASAYPQRNLKTMLNQTSYNSIQHISD